MEKFCCNRTGANGKRFTVAVTNRQEVTQQAEKRGRSLYYNKWEVIDAKASLRLVALTAFLATSKPMVAQSTRLISLKVIFF